MTRTPVSNAQVLEINWSQLLKSKGRSDGSSDLNVSKGVLIAAGAVFLAALAVPTVAAYISRRSQRQRRVGSPSANAAAKDASTDIKVLLKLDADEALAGCEKQVSYNATIGSEIVHRTATLNVPGGIVDGHIIRLKGWGGSAASSAPCGDLVLEIMVEDPDDDN